MSDEEEIIKEKSTNEIKDSITDSRNLQYVIIQRTKDIEVLEDINKSLKNRVIYLEKKTKDLENGAIRTYDTEIYIKELENRIENNEKEKQSIINQCENKISKVEEEKDVMKSSFDKDMANKSEEIHQMKIKLDLVTDLESIIEKQKEGLAKLANEKNNIKSEMKGELQNQELKANLKFDELKNQMRDKISEAQKNMKNFNVENMEVTTKVVLLQNQQLLSENAYHTDNISQLVKKNDKLEKKNYLLLKDIELHKDTELHLGEKIKKLLEKLKIVEENNSSANLVTGLRKNSMGTHKTDKTSSVKNFESANLNNLNNLNSPYSMYSPNNIYNINSNIHSSKANNISINNNIKEFNIINSFEAKIKKLEAELLKKQEDLTMLKLNYDYINDKFTAYEKKFSGIFRMFEAAIKKLIEDNGENEFKELNINLDLLKEGNFDKFSSQQKFSLLVALMKHIIPLINPQELQLSEFVKLNLNHKQIKYHEKVKNMFNESMFKKVGIVTETPNGLTGSGLNGIKSSGSYLDKLPLINDILKSTKNRRNNSVSNLVINV